MTRIVVGIYASSDFPPDVANEIVVGNAMKDFVDEHRDNQVASCCFSDRQRRLGVAIRKSFGPAGFFDNTAISSSTIDGDRKKLLERSTHALIFWDGKSAGTKKFIDMVEEKGIPFGIHIYHK